MCKLLLVAAIRNPDSIREAGLEHDADTSHGNHGGELSHIRVCRVACALFLVYFSDDSTQAARSKSAGNTVQELNLLRDNPTTAMKTDHRVSPARVVAGHHSLAYQSAPLQEHDALTPRQGGDVGYAERELEAEHSIATVEASQGNLNSSLRDLIIHSRSIARRRTYYKVKSVLHSCLRCVSYSIHSLASTNVH